MYIIGGELSFTNNINAIQSSIIIGNLSKIEFKSTIDGNFVNIKGNVEEVALLFYKELIKYFNLNSDYRVIKLYDLITVDMNNNKIEYIGSDEPPWFKDFSKSFIKISELKAFL